METKSTGTTWELEQSELQGVAGGQEGRVYCVYGANGTVGVNDYTQMVSRPLQSGECCSSACG